MGDDVAAADRKLRVDAARDQRAVRIHAARGEGDEKFEECHAVAHAGRTRHAHEAHHPALQHQFDSMSQQKEAAVLGMWAFLLTEILFFGGLFMAYMLYRTWYHDAFVAASTLDRAVLGRAQHGRPHRQLADDGAGGARGADQPAQGDGQLAALDDGSRHGVPRRQGDRVRRQVRASPRSRARISSGPDPAGL